MAVFLALAASALWGLADFGGGLLSRRRAALAVVVTSQFLALVALGAFIAATGAAAVPLPWQGLAAGAVGAVALLAFYRCLAIGPMGLVAPIASTGVVVPVLYGVLTGERLGMIQIAGIGLAVAGIVLASGPELQAGASIRGSAITLAVLAAAGFGMVYVFLADSPEAATSTLLAQRLASVALGAALLLATRTPAQFGARELSLLAVVGIADVAANGAFILGSSRGLVSVVAVLASLYPVATALLARYVLAERLRPIQTAGAAAALGGVLLLGAAS